jgi:hypothetical protein
MKMTEEDFAIDEPKYASFPLGAHETRLKIMSLRYIINPVRKKKTNGVPLSASVLFSNSERCFRSDLRRRVILSLTHSMKKAIPNPSQRFSRSCVAIL